MQQVGAQSAGLAAPACLHILRSPSPTAAGEGVRVIAAGERTPENSQALAATQDRT